MSNIQDELFILEVRGCADYKIVDHEFMFNLFANEDFRKKLRDRAKLEYNVEEFEYRIVSIGPKEIIMQRNFFYFNSKN
jgi:hypothetical protein